jgi:hypothetical protein
MYSIKYLILILLISCGKRDEKCISRKEAILRCQSDKVQKYYHGEVPKDEMQQCKNDHLVESCY